MSITHPIYAALSAVFMSVCLSAASCTNPPAAAAREATAAELMEAQDAAARAKEMEALTVYEQADFEFMRGDAELPETPHEH